MTQTKQRIAIIGAGISGLASAYLLNRKHEVVLFEAGSYLGGHTNTVDVTLEGQTQAVDTGFLVFNQQTYPNLIALFAELGVESYATDMSFGVSLNDGQLEWAGTNLATVFAQKRNLASPTFLLMLRDILRFNAAAKENLVKTSQSGATLAQLLDEGGYGSPFRNAYLLPMAAAIWSSSPKDILAFPAATFLRFCLNHALLQVNDRPQWQTVKGGAREYVRKIAATLADIRLNTPVLSVNRIADGVELRHADGVEAFDAVIFATHAPQTLAILQSPSPQEQAILGAVRYQANTAYLHTDAAQLPLRRKVWSAWNYLGGEQIDGERAVCVSYLLNQLQNLPFASHVVVTLNPFKDPAPEKVLARFEYEHPVFDQAAIYAQQALPTIQGVDRIWYAGAWTGYGFHEDGLKSALRVVADFGVLPDWAEITP
ncbi:FAD-dependent oxidoreductase [Chitinibacter bivalviorum]|uniref:FAD-dependent oxidoreductase n=1 Tax=Chitinibacter bivalviorum TaxID=2739434 RepID=A0A7H9BFV3_9NEIS|nr:FAD-dependent oxidoreductase [Chitinibacter bivalviorum]QLG87499.1 FAD-dependent oxidoreductase [Chitinibacter bivalviorum]